MVVEVHQSQNNRALWYRVGRFTQNGIVFGPSAKFPGDDEGKLPTVRLWDNNVVKEIHRSYLAAGADAVTTNTFGGSPITLGEFGLQDEAFAINKLAVELAREVVAEFAEDGRSNLHPEGHKTLRFRYDDTAPAEVAHLDDNGVNAAAGILVDHGLVRLVARLLGWSRPGQ